MQSNNADNPIKKKENRSKIPFSNNNMELYIIPHKTSNNKTSKSEKKKATIKNSIGSALFATQQMNISAS